MTSGQVTKRGALIWDFLATLIAARRVYLSIYRRFARRVLRAARDRGVPRTELKLGPKDLWELFRLNRLESLRDDRLAPLRALSESIFGEGGDEGLMDSYCGHIFHEISILCEEHRSVGRFVRHHDPRRYRPLFEEVSGYYPLRLNRVMRFFRSAMKRLDELLPRWSDERIVVRSVFLFGDRLGRRAYGHGREDFYARMYPEGGAVRGYLEAGRSFYESGFLEHAREAFSLAMATWEAGDDDLRSRLGERRAIEEVREHMAALVRRPGARLEGK
jgi:hypothetical protein